MLDHGNRNTTCLAFHGLGLDLAPAADFARTLLHWLPWGSGTAPASWRHEGWVFVPHPALFMTGCLARGP